MNLTNNSGTSASRLKLLTPLVTLIVLLVLILAISLFYFKTDSQNYTLIQDRMTRTQSVAMSFYEENIQDDISALRAIIDTLKYDEKLSRLFASYDRKALLEHTEPLFIKLKNGYNITHFYFTKVDRVNLLRVHSPERHGDRINRITTIRAEKNGALAYGIELGVLGTLTLRVVSPWHDKQTGRLIGYVEVGMEIDYILTRIREVFDLDVTLVIHKKYLQRNAWEEGMRVLDRDSDWNRFEKVVIGSEFSRKAPTELSKHLDRDELILRDNVKEHKHDGQSYWLLTIPIEDVSGRDVGQLALLADLTTEIGAAKGTVFVVGTAMLVLGGIFIIFFSWQASRIGHRIEHDELVLQQLATHDSLTGLYTRRMFHQYLDSELERATRFGHPLSLLLIDIDFFKKVNDDYGHQVGDIVLQKICERISKEARQVDYVCRYGGEEIAIVLPETDLQAAQKYATRINKAISALAFDIDNDRSISITVSIGVSSYPQQADTDTFLISAADAALYDAKEKGRDRVCTYTPGEASVVIGTANI
jgi:diguanylate cyclase (GGDEF)-like protein